MVSAQFVVDDFADLQEIDRCFQEREILQKLTAEQVRTISELERSLALEKRSNELSQRELELKDKMLAIKDQEIAAVNRSFGQMKEVADRAIKLAETVKPKSNWELLGAFGLVAIIITVIASAF